MNIGIVLVVLLILLVLGLPQLGLHNIGYAPSGLLTVVIIIIVILALTGRL